MTKLFFRAALLGTVALPVNAFAQDAAPAEEQAQPAADAPEEMQDGNDIVVTATKREQTLQDVPVAVSVTTAETIERAQIRDLKDLQTLVPTLRVTQLQSSANTNFIIRGFGNGANNAGIEPSVGVFVDGVYRSRTAAQIGDLPDVQRVEVLRGPQSTLFGKNASAGVISMVTKAPQFQFGGSVEATYGNYNAVVLKGVVTGPITDTVAASLAAGINKRDGYVDDLGYNGEGNDRNRWFVRGQMLFEPNDALRVRIIGDYDQIDEVCCAVVNLRRSGATAALEAIGGRINNFADPFADVTYSNFPSSNKIENYGVSGQVDYEVGPLKVTSITAYRESHSRTNQDSDFTSADLIGENRDATDIETFTQELRLSASFLDVFSAMIGGYYFNEDVLTAQNIAYGTQFRPYVNILSGGGVTQLEQLVLGVPVGTFQRPGQGMASAFTLDNEAWSVFGNVDIEFADRFTLTLGANYTRDRKDVTSNVTTTDTFSALDFSQIGQQVIANTIIAGLGPCFDPVSCFIRGETIIGALAFAAANRNNPAVNPLLALRPLQFLPPFRNFPNAVESGKTRDGKWTWTARLAMEVTDTLNAYVSYATGFKASSFNLSRDSRPTPADYQRLAAAGLLVPNLTTGSRFAGPENARVIELGLKANWEVASANLTFFHQRVNGFQSNIFTGTGFALANAGQQTTYGAEFEGTVRPTKELSLNLAMVYLKPKYDSFPNSALGDASGREPAGTPGISATFGGQYNKELSNGDRIILRADYHHESPVQIVDGLPGFIQRNALGQVVSYQPAFDAARPFTREVNEVNASLTYAMMNGLELSVWARNLTDNRYLITIFDSVAQSGSISGYPNQPRTFGATARFKF